LSKRNYDDQYREFLASVKKRDKNKCQLCGSKYRIEVHHILKWSSFPSVRYDPANGICLCKKCHKDVTRKENYYAVLLSEIASVNTERYERTKSLGVRKRRGRKPKDG